MSEEDSLRVYFATQGISWHYENVCSIVENMKAQAKLEGAKEFGEFIMQDYISPAPYRKLFVVDVSELLKRFGATKELKGGEDECRRV